MKTNWIEKLTTAYKPVKTWRRFYLFLHTALIFSWILLIFSGIDHLAHFTENRAVQLFAALTLISSFTLLALFIQIRSLKPLALARLIEQQLGDLKNSLVCVVEHQAQAQPANALVSAISDQLETKLQTVSFTQLMTPPKLKNKRFIIEGLLTILALSFALTSPFAQKVKDGLSDPDPLRINEEISEVPRLSTLRISFEIPRGPLSASIEWLDNQGQRSQPAEINGNTAYFTFYEINAPLRFKLNTPTLSSKRYEINVFNPPQLNQALLQVIPPAYTGKAPYPVNPAQSQNLPENAQLLWKFGISPKEATATLTQDQNELALTANTPGVFEVQQRLTHSIEEQSLTIQTTQSRQVEFPLGQIRMIPDLPPEAAIVTPDPDIVHRIDQPLEITWQGADDYGMTAVSLHFIIPGRQEAVISLFTAELDQKPTLSQSASHFLTPTEMEIPPYTTISYYLSVTDNRQPEPQTTRSELQLVEFLNAEDFEKQENAGGGGQGGDEDQKKVELPLPRLIAELKRLIRETMNTQLLTEADYDSAHEILIREFGALRLETAKLSDHLVQEMNIAPDHPAMTFFTQVLQQLEQAESMIRDHDLQPSLPIQTAALSSFNRLLREIQKEQQKQQQQSNSQCKSGEKQAQGQGKEGKQQAQSNEQESQPISQEELQKLQQQLALLADRQQLHNRDLTNLSRHQGSMSERMRLNKKQQELRTALKEITKPLAQALQYPQLNQTLADAQSNMRQSGQQLVNNRLDAASAHGQESFNQLKAAAELLNDALQNLTKARLEALKEQIGELQQQQQKLSEQTRQQSKGSPQADALKTAQNQLTDAMDGMNQQLSQLQTDTENQSAQAGQALSQAIKSGKEAQRQSGRAGKALQFERFQRAVNEQQKTNQKLQALQNQLQQALEAMPQLNRSQMEALRNQLQQQAQQVSRNGSQPQQLQQLGRQLSKAAGALDELNLLEVGMTLENLEQIPNVPGAKQQLAQLLMNAADRLDQLLIGRELEDKQQVERLHLNPPEQFRQSIEDYFKSLSE